MKLNKTPAGLGYYFPAEWHRHRATWLSWPHNRSTWPGGIEPIFDSYLRFIEELSRWETVCINVADRSMELAVVKILMANGIDSSKIEFYHHPTNDAWCRDHGPCFLINPEGNKMVVDWDYNAWGGKYPPFDLDDKIPGNVAAALGHHLVRPGVVLEGGSVDFNGRGTVLTTTSCLLNPNRNPEITKEKMAEYLKEYFGVSQVLWLEHGISGDDTDGHIDTITRFIDHNTVLAAVEEDPLDDNYGPLQENLKALNKMRLSDGASIEVIPLPMPEPRFHQGQRLPASYANFYICNGAVLVPTYGDPGDEVALDILAKAFKTRQIVGIDSTEIIRGLGSLHCLCMQEPVGTVEQ